MNFFNNLLGDDKRGKKPLGNLLSGQKKGFKAQGQTLGGSKPGQIIPMELTEAGPLGIKIEKRPQGSAIVSMVVEGSQAERAGLQRGDVLCFAGSNGQEEILYKQFIDMAASDQRPLTFDARRIPTKAATDKPTVTADSLNRKQAMIAAAEAREKAHKAKSKPVPKKREPTEEEKQRREEQRRAMEGLDDKPMSEASRLAAENAKRSEARTAAELGYNPYETNKVTAGQARNATVASKHGSVEAGASASDQASIPRVAPPSDPGNRLGSSAPSPATSEAFQAAYETVITSNDHATVKSSFGILRTLIVNATTKGQDTSNEEAAAKFRRVRLANAKIKAAVVDLDGGIDLMLAVGFHLVEDEASGESVLTYPPGDKGAAWIPTALTLLKDYD